jgi:hypothetical protein
VPDRVEDVPPLIVEDLGGDHSDPRVGLGHRDELAHEPRRRDRVAVEQDEVAPPSDADADVVSTTETEVAPGPQQPHPAAEALLQGRVGPVARTVVHHEHFDVGQVLLQQARHGLFDEAAPVEVDDDGRGPDRLSAHDVARRAVRDAATLR